MPPAPGATKAVGMVPDEMKCEPRSKGLSTPRKKKPKELAVITECCTGCAASRFKIIFYARWEFRMKSTAITRSLMS